MIALGPLRGKSRLGVTANLVLGTAFVCYGVYLTFIFRGGHYLVSYWVLILPVVLIARTIRSSDADKVQRREEAKQARYAELQDAQEAHSAVIERHSPAK